ncbi:hypothetical protein CDEF62S_00025 [Castellaniella defragrans]
MIPLRDRYIATPVTASASGTTRSTLRRSYRVRMFSMQNRMSMTMPTSAGRSSQATSMPSTGIVDNWLISSNCWAEYSTVHAITRMRCSTASSTYSADDAGILSVMTRTAE